MKRTTWIIASLMIALSVTPYANAFAQAPSSSAHSQTTMSSGAAADQPSDSTLSKEVKQALANDPLTQSGKIQVTTEDRMVILSGTVPSRKAARRAELIASRVNGVKGIENRTHSPSH